MIEALRALLEVVSGVAEVPRRRAQRIARDIVSQSGERASAVSQLAEDIVKRSRENAEMLRSMVSSEIRRQIRSLGLATREDVDRVAKRVRELERMSAARAKRPTAKAKQSARPS
ncbi:MAG: hypothetical protein ACRDI1_07145 [Actinomycetota bacterium]